MDELDDLIRGFCSVCHAGESRQTAETRFTAGALGLVLLSGGRVSVRTEDGTAAGGTGCIFLTRLPFTLQPLEACHFLCVCLIGTAPAALAAQLHGPAVQDPGQYPLLGSIMTALCGADASTSFRTQSALAFQLVCTLRPDAVSAPGWPPLVQQAVNIIRADYGRLYGVDELADRLSVTKSHLVRAFHAALGVTPGQYLTDTRIEAARQLLVRGHTLEVVATLCGFSGANYFCKVFKKETGMTPAAFRRAAQTGAAPTAEAPALAESAEEGLFL